MRKHLSWTIAIATFAFGFLISTILHQQSESETSWNFLTKATPTDAVVSLSKAFPSHLDSDYYQKIAQIDHALGELDDSRLKELNIENYSGTALQKGIRDTPMITTLLFSHWARENPSDALDWYVSSLAESDQPPSQSTSSIVAHEFVNASSEIARSKTREFFKEKEGSLGIGNSNVTRLWQNILVELLRLHPKIGMQIWHDLPVFERKLIGTYGYFHGSFDFKILLDELESGTDLRTDLLLRNKILSLWIMDDGDSAFSWISKNIRKEERVAYCIEEARWKKIAGGKPRWEWIKNRLSLCNIDFEKHVSELGLDLAHLAPNSFELMLAELKYPSSRDDAHASAVFGAIYARDIDRAISHLRKIDNTPTRQETYMNAVRSRTAQEYVNKLLSIIDEMKLSDIEKEALIGTFGLFPDSDRLSR